MVARTRGAGGAAARARALQSWRSAAGRGDTRRARLHLAQPMGRAAVAAAGRPQDVRVCHPCGCRVPPARAHCRCMHAPAGRAGRITSSEQAFARQQRHDVMRSPAAACGGAGTHAAVCRSASHPHPLHRLVSAKTVVDSPDVVTLVHSLFEVVLATSHDVEVQVSSARVMHTAVRGVCVVRAHVRAPAPPRHCLPHAGPCRGSAVARAAPPPALAAPGPGAAVAPPV
jgi:hypothetical protein